MKIGNDIRGKINGSIIHIDEVELDLVVRALEEYKIEAMCVAHENMIDKLTAQFEAMFREMTKISEKELDNQDEGWYNKDHENEVRYG
jgi:hypothetical protein